MDSKHHYTNPAEAAFKHLLSAMPRVTLGSGGSWEGVRANCSVQDPPTPPGVGRARQSFSLTAEMATLTRLSTFPWRKARALALSHKCHHPPLPNAARISCSRFTVLLVFLLKGVGKDWERKQR